MRCDRCGMSVPEFLWIGDDHPVIVEEIPMKIYRTDNIENNTVKFTMEQTVQLRFCSDVNPPKKPIGIFTGQKMCHSCSAIVPDSEKLYTCCSSIIHADQICGRCVINKHSPSRALEIVGVDND